MLYFRLKFNIIYYDPKIRMSLEGFNTISATPFSQNMCSFSLMKIIFNTNTVLPCNYINNTVVISEYLLLFCFLFLCFLILYELKLL